MDKYEGHIAYPIESIPDCPGYLIDCMGNIWGNPHGWRGYGWRKLKQLPNTYGYPYVRLTVQGKRKKHYVHKLMGKVFLDLRPSPEHEIRHLDGNPTNNSFDNLDWGTRQDNANDREKHGRTSRGCKHSEAIKKGLRNARKV